jgi:hypothetical protein
MIVMVPKEAAAGQWRLWVHAGMGGKYGWSQPAAVAVTAPKAEAETLDAVANGVQADDGQDDLPALQAALKAAAGKVVQLPRGEINLSAPMVLTDGQKLRGDDAGTLLQLSPQVLATDFKADTHRLWQKAVGSIHAVGDYLKWRVKVPAAGDWNVWLYYAADNAPYGIQDMGGHTQLQADDAQPVPLANMPNTGGFGEFKWSQCAKLTLQAGDHVLTWKNVTGGGLNFDKLALSLDADWKPATPEPQPGDRLLVIEAESYFDGFGRDWATPDRAAVTLAGRDCSLDNLVVLAGPACTAGVLVRDAEDAALTNLTVTDVPTAANGASGVYITGSHRVRVDACTVRGRSPVLLNSVRNVWVTNCTLRPDHGTGDGALGTILGYPPILHCVVSDNQVETPRGTPEAMRLLWWCTAGGCTAENYIGYNDGEDFGGQPGDDQNVGEAILFETCLTQPYYGAPAAAGDDWVELPDQGPDWSLLRDIKEGRYAVMVLGGPGAGQARPITGLQGRRLALESPWLSAPTAESQVLVTELFYRNHIVGNSIRQAMTGIQLWINGVENVIAGNRLERMRREGILVYGMCNGIAPAATPGWNGGIGAVFYNLVADNHVEGTEYGVRVNVGNVDAGGQPIPWPLAMGNVCRHNTVVCARATAYGADLRCEDKPLEQLAGRLLVGTVFEYGRAEDCPTALSVSQRASQTLARRNHFYYWNTPHDASTGIAYDKATEGLVNEANEFEGPGGMNDDWIKRQVER